MTTTMSPSHSRSLPIPRHLLPARSLPDLSLHYDPPSSHRSDSPTLFHEDGVSPDFALRSPPPPTPTSPYSNAKSRYMDFHFDLAGGSRGKHKARLILSAETRLSRHVPTYLEGSPLKGALELNFEQSETVAAITAMVSCNKYRISIALYSHPTFSRATRYLDISSRDRKLERKQRSWRCRNNSGLAQWESLNYSMKLVQNHQHIPQQATAPHPESFGATIDGISTSESHRRLECREIWMASSRLSDFRKPSSNAMSAQVSCIIWSFVLSEGNLGQIMSGYPLTL